MGGEGDIRFTLRETTGYWDLTGRAHERVDISLDGQWITDEGTLFYTHVEGDNYFRLDEWDYGLRAQSGFLGIRRGAFNAQLGLLSQPGLWGSTRLLGAQFELGNPQAGAEIHGGWFIETDYHKRGIPEHQGGNGLVGASIYGGDLSHFLARARYDQTIQPGGDLGEGRLGIRFLNPEPYGGHLTIYGATTLYFGPEPEEDSLAFQGYKLYAGISVQAHENLLFHANYRGLDRTTPINFGDGLSRSDHHTGEVGVTITRPEDRIRTDITVRAGSEHIDGNIFLEWQRLGVLFLYGHEYASGSHDIGGNIHYSRLLGGGNWRFRAGATLVYNTGDEEVFFNIGGRIRWNPLEWLAVVLGVSYTHSSNRESQGSVDLSIEIGRTASSRSSHPDNSQNPESLGTMVQRLFGELMNSITTRFNHPFHVGDGTEANQGMIATTGHEATCDMCHSPDGRFSIPEEIMNNVCGVSCHIPGSASDITDEFRGLARMRHSAGNVRGLECQTCHIDVATLERPTQGQGSIIEAPHPVDGEEGHWEQRLHQVRGRIDRLFCNTCHESGRVQYENNEGSVVLVETCDSCHQARGPSSHWREGWNEGAHAPEARGFQIVRCVSCHEEQHHTTLNQCRSCHQDARGQGNLDRPTDHLQGSFLRYVSEGTIGHELLSEQRGIQTCFVCHENPDNPTQEPSCQGAGCHGGGR